MTDCLQPKSSVDHPEDESGGTNREPETSGASATKDVNMTFGSATTDYTYISLGDDFPDFFGPNRSTILVRDEYPLLMTHLEGVQAGDREVRVTRYGVIVIGRPGIGQEPP
jgi:hypothetical protein